MGNPVEVVLHTSAGFVIQGGGYTYHSATDTFSSIVRDPAVVNEPGSSNIAGTIWMV
ncbi:MAG: hypothetical protein P8Q97_06575 [Myxococcota bacterium]|nr:hypothetical protein [Myxococcota bacterium]